MTRSARGENVLLTGGSGRLGTELRELMPEIHAPSRAECDVADPESIASAFGACEPTLVVHAAAYTSVVAAEDDRAACWRINVVGTRNVVAACRARRARLIHISTDYVFWGNDGGYREDDPPGPVRNYYALTKLAAEESVRSLSEHLIVRTSFRAREWPYPKAFADLYTSQDYVDVIAPEIALAIRAIRAIPYRTLHIATERKSAYELARRRRPDVEEGRKQGAGVALPDDISLDTSRWAELRPALVAYLAEPDGTDG